MFRDEEFADACLEINTPVLDKWDFFTESYNKEIKVFKKMGVVSPRLSLNCNIHNIFALSL